MIEQRMETDAKTGAMKGVSLDRYDLIPPRALEYLALIYGKGSQKYADRNWEKGYKWGLSFRALLKHAFAAWRGEWLDPESGLPHIMHAAWHCFALCTYHEYNLGTDDRTTLREPEDVPMVLDIPRVPSRPPFLVELRGKVVELPHPEDVVEQMERTRAQEATRRFPCRRAVERGVPWSATCPDCNPVQTTKGAKG